MKPTPIEALRDEEGYWYTAERLALWLEAKYVRHSEYEDLAAAKMLRAFAAAEKAEPVALKPLSDEQIEALANTAWNKADARPDGDWSVEFARAIEAAHGIKS